MIKSVNIDGKDYLIRSCGECPFFYDGCWEFAIRCQYPTGAREIPETGFDDEEVQKDCPLSLVKDCFSCRYDGEQRGDGIRCEGCTVTFHTDTGIEDPPTRWEAKE